MPTARQAVRITKEATYGTYNGSALTADKAIIELSSDSPITMMMKPRIFEVRNAAYDGRKVRQGSKQAEASGKLTTYLYPGQCDLILRLATAISGSGCRFLPSFTIDYLYLLEDGSCTPAYERFLGCVIGQADINSNNNGQGVLVTADLDIMAQKRVTTTSSDFSQPLAADYPANNPFLFQDTAGTLVIGSGFTNYSALNLSIKNALQARFDEFQYAWRVAWRSRDISLTVNALQKTNAIRDAYEAQTPLSVEWHYNNGGDDLKIELNDNNFVRQFSMTRPLQGDFEQSFTIENNIDPATGTDMTFTYTPET